MGKTIFFVHGRNIKPPPGELREVWLKALEIGLRRDCPDRLACLRQATAEVVYYGDLSYRYLTKTLHRRVAGAAGRRLISRYERSLRKLATAEEKTLFDLRDYLRLRNRPRWRARVMQAAAFLLERVYASGPVISVLWPDVKRYWDARSEYHRGIMQRMRPVEQALCNGDDVLLMAHSLGTVVCYDFLWTLSQGSAVMLEYPEAKIDLWITLGSPLGGEAFKHHTRGWRRRGARRYPANIRRWVNISAKDDTVAYDPTVADDYREMVRSRKVEAIYDYLIPNPAEREGKVAPHAIEGYLAHPITVHHVAEWLSESKPSQPASGSQVSRPRIEHG